MTEDSLQLNHPEKESGETGTPLQDGFIAPWWHMVFVIVVLAGWSGSARTATYQTAPHLQRYFSTAASQFVLLGAIVAGIYHRRDFFVITLLRSRRSWWVESLRGVGLYIAGMFFYVLTITLLRPVVHIPSSKIDVVFSPVAPSSHFELFLWALVSLCIGFCEEHQMRGYFLRQFIALGGSVRLKKSFAVLLAVAVSSAFFGCLHLYEGIRGVLSAFVLGTVYAVAALRFGNLRAVIVAHALQDFTALLFLSLRLHTLR